MPPSGVAVAVPEQAGYPAAVLGNAHAGLIAHQRTQRVWMFTKPQPLWVRPADAPVYTGPVVLLTGGSTISAGETFG